MTHINKDTTLVASSPRENHLYCAISINITVIIKVTCERRICTVLDSCACILLLSLATVCGNYLMNLAKCFDLLLVPAYQLLLYIDALCKKLNKRIFEEKQSKSCSQPTKISLYKQKTGATYFPFTTACEFIMSINNIKNVTPSLRVLGFFQLLFYFFTCMNAHFA